MQASELRGKFEHAADEETGKYADLPSRCQTRQVLNQVTEQSVSYSVERSDTPEDFGRLLRESISFVEMQRALNPLTIRDHLPLIVDQYKVWLPEYEKSVPANSWLWRHLERLVPPSLDHRLRAAIALMRDRVTEKATIEEIASKVGLSRAHFFALFRDQLNTTPQIFWSAVRVEEAMRRLINQGILLPG